MDMEISETIPFKSYSGIEPFIFVSYSHQNKEIVYNIINKLYQQEYRIWYDEGIEPGVKFAERISDRISTCHTFMVFLSKESLQSNHVISEIGIAFEESKTIIPILLQEDIVLPKDVRYFLGSIQHVLQNIQLKITSCFLKKYACHFQIKLRITLKLITMLLLNARKTANM